MTTPNTAQYANASAPAFWQQFTRSYTSASNSAFVFHGNVDDHILPGVYLRGFLKRALATFEVIVFYDRATGWSFPLESMENKARDFLGMNDAPAAPNPAIAALMGNAATAAPQKPAFPTDPTAALPLLGRLLAATDIKAVVIISHAETILPAGELDRMPAAERTLLVQMLEWGRADSPLPNPLILVVKSLTELNAGLRAATSGYRAIELPIPTAEQRLAFIEWFTAAQPVNFEGLTAQDLANQTAGLTLVHVENILLEADQSGRLTVEASRRMKDDMIRSEYAGLVEIMEPSYGFDAIGGMERIKAWAKTEIIEPVKQGRTADCPKGVILVGPPGTGKTYFVRGLAREIGFNAVSISMDKILGGIVGESEKRMARVLGLVKALAPVLVFMDEIDQSDVAQRGNGSGNPVASNLFSQMLQFMSDEGNRGRVVFFAASNRPDLIDPAMMRFGRTDAVIPVLLPNEAERAAILAAQAKTQGAQISAEATQAIVSRSANYSAADLAAVVAKARKISAGQIDASAANRAIAAIRPGTVATAQYYTLLAVNAVNDRDLLPDEYAGLLEDRQGLEAQIEAQAPARRSKREL